MRVLDALGADIAGGYLEPGTVLTLNDLQEKYSVSRTVVREATAALTSLHLIEARQRVGLTVLPENCWDSLHPKVLLWRLSGRKRQTGLTALRQLHAAIAPAASALAAAHASSVQRLEILAAGSRADAHRGECVTFHELVLLSTGNPLMQSFAPTLAHLADPADCPTVTPGASIEFAVHSRVARAIVDGSEATHALTGTLFPPPTTSPTQ
ncbi:FadR/GntR family transcriptional regulator [Pseudoclavibacter sp. VKM Ac-2867]|mgnify:CR=1 FL=1|uniref:FadR/GntR family transcriptional regulator n=1 Tax=Pseudoclavibacter sp. VKM Ac-2867 TaxID=2783829 RepID=UPI00188D31EC|nr:GntR family transcriptional regulator [Pseudoclavibacter sp. VKM Ac-2867]MBF4460106.1 FadR family transcriptional regulator [Pseudoclavibacter sp. VKM Ac-2867]